MAKARDIGVDVQAPARECSDQSCPFHGSFPVRGQQIVGQVISAKMQNSVLVRREYLRYMPKFERFEKRTSKYTAHHPSCIDVRPGDQVTIMECRPISKTKKFVVIEARAGQLGIKGMDYTEREGTAPGAPQKTAVAPKKESAKK